MKPAGFTLIEVMVSAVLLALVGMMLLQTMTSSIDVKDRVEDISDRYHMVRQAMSRMSREISMAYVSGHKNVNDLVVETVFKGDKDKLLFTAFGNVTRMADAKQSDQRIIEYTLGTDQKTNTQSLMRRERLNPGKNLREGGTTNVLCPNIKSLQFEYWNQELNKWDSAWDTDSVVYKGMLPKRVRISIVGIMDSKKEEKFLTQSEIWLTAPVLVK